MDIIKIIFEVAKSLFGLRTEIEKAARDKRDRAAEYFSDIAKLIEEVSASLKLKVYPHGSCAQLEALAREMDKSLADSKLKEKDIQENQEKLLKVHEIELLFGEIYPLKDSEIPAKLKELDESAGIFRALAAHLKVSSK